MYSANPFEEVRRELAGGYTDEALWLRSLVEGGGNQERALAIYCQHRATLFAKLYQQEQAALKRENETAKKAQRERKAIDAKRVRANARWDARLRREQFWDEHGLMLIGGGLFGLALLLFVLL